MLAKVDSSGNITGASFIKTGGTSSQFLKADGTTDSTSYLSWVAVPANATSAGTAGQVAYDTDYIYICTATNTWKRVGIATW
jgi:hypothetical protein